MAFLAHPFILLSDNSDFLYNKFSNAVNKLEAAGEKHQAAATTFILGTPKAAKLLEKNIVKRITDIQQLPVDDKAHLFALMDAFLRDHKAKKAYATVK